MSSTLIPESAGPNPTMATGSTSNAELRDISSTTDTSQNTTEVSSEESKVITGSLVTMESSSPTRVPYKNGYGDFCFGRWAARPGSFGDRNQYSQQSWEVGSNGVKVVELNDFQRTGSFPFMKLPIVVREAVYRLLLGPFYRYSKTERNSYICLQITTSPFNSNDQYDHGYDHYLKLPKVHRRVTRSRHCECCSPITLEEFEKRKAYHDHQYARHPARKDDYDLELFPIREFDRRRYNKEHGDYSICHNKIDYLYLEWFRGLSNVSNILRTELAKVFWTRVGISTTGGGVEQNFCCEEFQELWLIPKLLEDRPNTHSGIKYLNMDLDVSTMLSGSDDIAKDLPSTLLGDFKNLCNLFSDTLKLDKLALHLSFWLSDEKVLTSDAVVTTVFTAARNLHVTKSFTVDCSKITPDDDAYEFLHSDVVYMIELQAIKKYNRLFAKMMLPNTLRPRPAKNEMESYIQSRTVTQTLRRPSSPAPSSKGYKYE